MIQSKHSREFDSSEEASKRQKLSKNYGIFVSGIPNRVSLKTIIDGFADDSFFVPMYRKKNIHIAYFLFETESERDNKYMTIFNLSPEIVKIQFSLSTNCSFDETLNIFATISQKFYDLNRNTPVSSELLRKSLSESKDIAQNLLAVNYLNIKHSFLLLNQNRTETLNIESTKLIEWIIMFYMCWFICFRLNEQNYENLSFFFDNFRRFGLIQFFEEFNQRSPIIKYFAFDVL